MNNWSDFFQQKSASQARANLKRARSGPPSSPVIDFGSNDYLGFRRHSSVIAAVQQAAEQGWGSGASPVIGGYSPLHSQLETELAQLSGQADCITFSSGFGCNLGTLACLATDGDLVLSDQLNHASLIDGIRLSRAHRQVYPHLQTQYVADFLSQHRHEYAKVMLVTESIFSMDGDAAPLEDLSDVCRRFDCGLVVDEAHATGVYGPRGGGLLEELRLEEQVMLKLGTLSKALGSIGGYACGPAAPIEYLVNHCRSYLFSTAMPAPVAAGALASLRLLGETQVERLTLREASRQLRRQLSAAGWNVPMGDSPIVPVIIGPEKSALALAERLELAGYRIPAIRPPTVPAGTARLRISLSSLHGETQIAGLIAAFGPAS